MFYTRHLFVVFGFLLFSTLPALASVDFSVGGGYLAGETKYQIGGRTVSADGSQSSLHFPISELRFPVNSFVVKGQLDAQFAKKWTLMLNAETNLTDDTGDMEDSDWGVWPGSPTSQLDIYSESDTEMDMYALEGKLTYQLYEGYYGENKAYPDSGNADLKFAYTVGVGYKYQNFDFEVYDLDQWYPSSPETPHDRVSGKILAYEAEYQIPYLELGMKMTTPEKFVMELTIGYAPLIHFEDKDQHLLRNKVNIADHGWDGDALMANLNVRYNLNRSWFLKADVEFMKIESDGRSKAYFNGVFDHSIAHEASSRQYRSYLMLGYSF